MPSPTSSASTCRPSTRPELPLRQLANAEDADALQREAWRICREHARRSMEQLARRIEPRADWDDLVLPEPQLQRAARRSRSICASAAPSIERWGFADKYSRGLGLTALFSGASGTGKTMAAEVLAIRCASTCTGSISPAVVSKYIGETEKNLRRVFDAAEDGGAILLFDEADALFGKRTEVKDSHDRYANIEVSYLLQRMEAYRGLAILTTNMRRALDAAFLRRIRFVVEFPFPDAAHRARIWRARLPGRDADGRARLRAAGAAQRRRRHHPQHRDACRFPRRRRRRAGADGAPAATPRAPNTPSSNAPWAALSERYGNDASNDVAPLRPAIRVADAGVGPGRKSRTNCGQHRAAGTAWVRQRGGPPHRSGNGGRACAARGPTRRGLRRGQSRDRSPRSFRAVTRPRKHRPRRGAGAVVGGSAGLEGKVHADADLAARDEGRHRHAGP